MSIAKFWPLGIGLVAAVFTLQTCTQDADQFEQKVKACAMKGAAYLQVHGYARGGQRPSEIEAQTQAETRCRTKGLDSFNDI